LNTRTTLFRIGRLYLIVTGIVANVIVLGAVVWLNAPALQAIAWHVRHGTHVTCGGHTFRAPWTWTLQADGNTLDLQSQHPIFFDGAGGIRLKPAGRVMDETGARAWQQERLALLNSHIKSPDKMSGEILHGKKLEFVCVRSNIGDFGESLYCQAVGADILVSTDATNNYQDKTRDFLTSSD
jgi:hypothetical protein